MAKYDRQFTSFLNKQPSLIKPIVPIKKLFKIIQDSDETFIFEKNKRISLSNEAENSYVYLIVEGYFSVERDIDRMLVASGFAPFILGSSTMMLGSCHINYSILTVKKCTGYRIPCNEVRKRITQHQLWPELAEVMAYIIQLYMQRDKYLVGVNAYTMIKYNLLKINELNLEDRMNINIEQFIQNHTGLSRSGIMKVLSDLKIGGYVHINKGRLIKLNYLPECY